MITDRYFTDEEFELKELNKGFWYALIGLPIFVYLFWGFSYWSYSNNEVKPIYLFIYTYFKYSVFIIIGLMIYNKRTKPFFNENFIGVLSVGIMLLSLIISFLSTILHYQGENRVLVTDTVFLSSLGLFILYFIIYFFRYIKRAEQGRDYYIKQLESRNFIIDSHYEGIEDYYFRIKNKKLEEKLDIIAIFIKIFTPVIVGLTTFIGWEYVKDGQTDPSIFIVTLGGIIGCSYFGSLVALVLVSILNIKQIEKQIGRKIYNGLYPETIARKKAEAKEDEEYWKKD